MDNLPSQIADQARKILGAHAALLLLLDGEELVFQGWAGLEEAVTRAGRLKVSESLTGAVIREGRPLVCPDLSKDPAWRETPLVRQFGYRAMLAVPLTIENRLVGVLKILHREPRLFLPEEVKLLGALATQAALAVENARLFEESERLRRAGESLAEVGGLISQSLDPLEVGQRIVESVRTVLGARESVLWRLEPESGDLVGVAFSGDVEPAFGRDLIVPHGTRASGLAVSERRTVVTSDILADPRITLLPDTRALLEQIGGSAVITVPLVFGDRVIGTLGAGDRVGRVFGDDEVRLLESFAAQAAVAIENARLYAETTRRLRETQALLEVSEILSSTLELKRLLKAVTIKTAQACQVDRCTIELWEGDRMIPVMSQFADGRKAPELWAKFMAIPPRPPGEIPAYALAIQTKKPVVISDASNTDMIPREWVETYSLWAFLVVPLIRQDQVVGVMNLDYTDRMGTFEPGQVDLAVTIAGQVALALENARLFEESERRRLVAEELARLAQMLTESLDVSTVSERIVDSLLRLFNARTSSLRLLRADGSQEAIARAGATPELFPRGFVWPPGTGIAGRAIAEGRAIWCRDLLSEPGVMLTEDLRCRIAAVGISAVLVAPLRLKGGIIGVIAVSDRAGREFDDEEIGLAQAFADQAAVAIDNARLFARERAARSEAEASAQRQALQFAVTRVLAGAATFREAISKLLQTICECMGWDLGEMWLVDPAANLLRWDGIWHAPSVEGSEFEAVSRETTFPPGRGLPGRVWASGQPEWFPDVVANLEFLRASVAAREGLHAAFAFPILEGREITGVMAFFSRSVLPPDAEMLKVVADLGSQIGQFAARKRMEDALLQSEESLRQSQKMEAVGRLAGGIAHDFNNLLTVITGRSQLLLTRLWPEDPLRRDIDLIQKTAERASKLTRQLLAFSRKQVLQPKVLDLNAIMAEMEMILRRLIGEDIDFVTVLHPALGRVNADPGQLEQVIANLAVNDRDAMPQGGRLTIETANVELDEPSARPHPGLHPGRYVRLAVSDTGIGMDEETQSRIFEPFFTTKELGKGTGLGLATVYGIVKQSGGYIWVESAPGQGATFTIYLPRVEEPIEGAEVDKAPVAAISGLETILLVEDEEEVRNLAREILMANGYNVLEARHGGQALLIAEEHAGPIHLLLTDVVMPQMSGRELPERLVPLRPELRVLYMSGYTDDALAPHGVLDPGSALLEKPFTPEALARKVREVLRLGG